MPLVTRLLASSELAWGPMASSSVNFCRKTRTVLGVQMIYLCILNRFKINWVDANKEHDLSTLQHYNSD
jgi:hypothetical protein